MPLSLSPAGLPLALLSDDQITYVAETERDAAELSKTLPCRVVVRRPVKRRTTSAVPPALWVSDAAERLNSLNSSDVPNVSGAFDR